ncbi:MAG: bifunctional precorrin-2 dehydrogenase/sirohydrochlorin ferrochelatase [Prevotella sp.]|nr:bifunctional precorrin-2 dehydrogenase/sirohydrochlorin ferrochelatase [Prevotella sp.]
MHFLPINIDIENKRLLIIGGGRVGLHKAQILARFTDTASVISPEFREGFDRLPFTLVRKEYEAGDLDGAFMVYICTEDGELNRRIKRDAQQRGVLASVCDNPSLCDFTSPAIFRKDNMTVAVASDARDVRRSMQIRDAIAENFDLIESHVSAPRSIYNKR